MNQLTNGIPRLIPASMSDAPQELDPSIYSSGTGEEPPPEFIEYWRAIMLRKWWILAGMVLLAVLTWLVVSQMTPVYRSTATVLIEANKSKIVNVEDVYNGASGSREYFQTQAETIKSREVALRVISELKLASNPEFDPAQAKSTLVRTFPFLESVLPEREAPASEAEAEALILQEFAQRLTVEPVRLSQLVRVSFDANDPELAAQIANAVSDAFIGVDREARIRITEGAGQSINSRLGELKARLDESERNLQAYRERQGLLDSKTMVLGGAGKQLNDLTQQLVEARVRRSEAEEAFNQTKTGEANGYESVPAVVRNQGVQRAKELEGEAEKKLAEASQRFGPDHPRYSAAQSDVRAAKANTKRAIDAVVASTNKEYSAARATERTIEDQMRIARSEIQTVNRKEIQATGLEREAATNRQLYENFLSRFKETSATNDLQTAAARLVDPAIPGLRPVRPAKLPAVALAALTALLIGVVVAVIHKRLNNRIQTTSDVERKLYQPLLAGLPILSGKGKAMPARVVLDEPGEHYAEAIRTASTGIMLSALDTPKKIVAVTSTVPGEGKSTFSINLAFWQAKTKKVLLMEADLRRPSIMRSLGLTDERKGLSELVAGTATLEESIFVGENTGLHLMVCGGLPPNPLELLVSQRFKEVLAQLQEIYDVIIIDTPPVHLVSDALVVGKLATGMIYVVKSDDTPTPMIKGSLKRIVEAHIPIIGVVLNQQDFRKASRYYGEYSAYGGKYGYGKYGGGYGAKTAS